MSASLQKRILDFIQQPVSGALTDDEFNRLAIQTYERQKARNSVYGKFCQMYGTKQPIRNWRDIPCLPVSSFKSHRVAGFAQNKCRVSFLSSGTTRGELKAKHEFETLELYDAVIQTLFRRYLLPDLDRIAMASLIAPYEPERQSSLSYMTRKAHELFGSGEMFEALQKSAPDFEGLAKVLKETESSGDKILILATTFSLAGFLEYLHRTEMRFSLPAGSRVMETGGYKGRRKEIKRKTLLRLASERLNIPASHVVNEYGMTELTSQFYDQTLAGGAAVKGVPPWTRVTVIGPGGEQCRAGQAGLVRVVDLANQGSVSFIQTEDTGRLAAGGFEILGRDPGADVRGCSLTFEEMESVS